MKDKSRPWYFINSVIGGILLSIVMIVAFKYFYLQAINPPSHLFVIDNVTFSPLVETSFDNANSSSSEQRTLPDDWMRTISNTRSGLYKTTFMLKQKPDELWAIYFPILQMSAKIMINQVLIGQVDTVNQNNRYSELFAMEGNRPQYFTVPDNLLKVGDNLLQVQVLESNLGSSLLGKIYLGNDRELRPVFNQRFSARITAVYIITAVTLAIAVLISILWLLRRNDHVYGWYALMLYTWSAHNYFYIAQSFPFSVYVQSILSVLTLGWFVVFLVFASHSYLDQKFPKREKILFSGFIVISLLLIFADNLPWSLLTSRQIWSTMMIMIAGYALLDFAIKYREREDLKNPLLIPAGFSILVFGIHDWLIVMQLIPRDGGLLLHYSAPTTVAVIGSLLLERFAGILKQAESLNLALEQRVAEKHQALENNYQRLKKMEHQQLLTEERERFMKEIHDGVGGHLISMLSMVRSGKQDKEKIVASIEATLDDLRIMIDSLAPHEHDIPALLGAMRSRLEPQLLDSQLELCWQVDELPAIPHFGPHKVLQVMRIVQEAVTNVIRHANATHIVVKAFVETGVALKHCIIIEINDDGIGISDDVKRGQGLNNMRYRASDIGATLNIIPGTPGTRIILALDI